MRLQKGSNHPCTDHTSRFHLLWPAIAAKLSMEKGMRVCVCVWLLFRWAWLAIHQYPSILQTILNLFEASLAHGFKFWVRYLTVGCWYLINAKHIVSTHQWCWIMHPQTFFDHRNPVPSSLFGLWSPDCQGASWPMEGMTVGERASMMWATQACFSVA